MKKVFLFPVAKFEKSFKPIRHRKATPGNLNNTQSIDGGRVTDLFEVEFMPNDIVQMIGYVIYMIVKARPSL